MVHTTTGVTATAVVVTASVVAALVRAASVGSTALVRAATRGSAVSGVRGSGVLALGCGNFSLGLVGEAELHVLLQLLTGEVACRLSQQLDDRYSSIILLVMFFVVLETARTNYTG